jgi:hypothetical protein
MCCPRSTRPDAHPALGASSRAVCTADPRSVHGAGRTRAGRAAVARQMPSIVTPLSCPDRAGLFNPVLLPLHTPPSHPARHCRRRSTPSSGRFLFNPSSLAHSLRPIESPRVAYCPPRAAALLELAPPRQPPPATVDPPRRQPLRPNSDHPSTVGELLVEPSRLPRRERRRLAGIGRSRAAPTAKDPIAGLGILAWCFV